MEELLEAIHQPVIAHKIGELIRRYDLNETIR
jgi:hypothetical protein